MTYEEYQVQAGKTAIYPGRGSDATYPGLGIGGELSEIAEVVCLASDMKTSCPPEAQATLPKRLAGLRQTMKKELGDVLWYVSALCDEAGFSLKEISDRAFSNGLPDGRKGGMESSALQLISKLGKVGEIVKKQLRDDGKKWTPERKALLYQTLVEGVLAWALVGRQWELPGPEIRAENIAKLSSRKARGVIKGSGNDR